MDRSTRSSKHKLFELVPEITQLERSNRKALRKNLFGDEMSSGGNNIPGGNNTTGGIGAGNRNLLLVLRSRHQLNLVVRVEGRSCL